MITVVGTSRIGGKTVCNACGAGGLISFNWPYALERGDSDDRRRRKALKPKTILRSGQLFQCSVCSHHWYLDGAAETMSIVSEDRLQVVQVWNNAPLPLPLHIEVKADAIRRTPPDLYGNGRQYGCTPCGVIIKGGEKLDLAYICVQRDAPVEDWRTTRLASEVLDIYPSPHALPIEVRIATAQAEEVRMGYAPTLIEMPDGKQFILNWTQSFLILPGYVASEARVVRGRPDPGATFVESPEKITYFVADR
ncbi:hypothetical protein [Caulobacter sp. DWR1-3-2b1]|uniref:hypothetical protein n=1 Tax=Caulobacter sp. DWR1-3-2b1 TaxID=2804670 RepID=UPI003CEF440B